MPELILVIVTVIAIVALMMGGAYAAVRTDTFDARREWRVVYHVTGQKTRRLRRSEAENLARHWPGRVIHDPRRGDADA